MGQEIAVYIGLGSNLDDPVEQVNKGLCALQRIPGARCVGHSSLYRSEPLGPSDQAPGYACYDWHRGKDYCPYHVRNRPREARP